jgi:hypothetical protein
MAAIAMSENDQPPEITPPESRRCAVCGEFARYYFGAREGSLQTAEGWYCGTHLHEGERAWAARRPSNGGAG